MDRSGPCNTDRSLFGGAGFISSLLAERHHIYYGHQLIATIFDLILRPTLGHRLHYTPTNFSPHRYPELPIVARWDYDQILEMESFGDLAAMIGDPALQERRRIVFRTDEFGFRNIPRSEPANVLILGDSFSAGTGTTDEDTFPRLLESNYGFRTYNLSYPGGPYDQFITFAIEWPRLKVTPRPHMIWTFSRAMIWTMQEAKFGIFHICHGSTGLLPGESSSKPIGIALRSINGWKPYA